MTDEGELNLDDIKATINDKTKIVAIAHVSNVLGTINDVKTIADVHMNMAQLLVWTVHKQHHIWH